MTTLLLLLLTTIPHDGLLRESFDAMEINHVHAYCEETDQYTYQFTQLLFLDFDREHGTHVIEAWRMQRSSGGDKRFADPELNHRTGLWELRFEDRRITAQAFRETSADFDVEVREREKLPAGRRRELR
jgi:hypothetical protein